MRWLYSPPAAASDTAARRAGASSRAGLRRSPRILLSDSLDADCVDQEAAPPVRLHPASSVRANRLAVVRPRQPSPGFRRRGPQSSCRTGFGNEKPFSWFRLTSSAAPPAVDRDRNVLPLRRDPRAAELIGLAAVSARLDAAATARMRLCLDARLSRRLPDISFSCRLSGKRRRKQPRRRVTVNASARAALLECRASSRGTARDRKAREAGLPV